MRVGGEATVQDIGVAMGGQHGERLPDEPCVAEDGVISYRATMGEDKAHQGKTKRSGAQRRKLAAEKRLAQSTRAEVLRLGGVGSTSEADVGKAAPPNHVKERVGKEVICQSGGHHLWRRGAELQPRAPRPQVAREPAERRGREQGVERGSERMREINSNAAIS